MQYRCKNEHVFEQAAKMIVTDEALGTIEFPVCPHCLQKHYSQYKVEEKITSVISVDLSEVDTKLKEGYGVESLYAKTATLVKKVASTPVGGL